MKLGIKIRKQKKEINFVDKLYKKLLYELAIILNNLHGVRWKTKSWEILIGPWLNRYIAIVVDRYRKIRKGKFKNNTGLKKKNT